ncbi:MAG: hypothetical protein WEE51_08010 [Pirellulaceae bacterium]
MFNRFWLGSLVLLVLLSSGCAIPTSKHPLVDPHEAISYPELYGAYRFEAPNEQHREPYLFHLGEAGEGYPPGFVRIIFVGFKDSVLGAHNMFTFAEKVGDGYVIHLPGMKNDRTQASEATYWKPWHESWNPAKDGWDGQSPDDYLLCRLLIRGERLKVEMLNSQFLVTEIEAGRLTGEVTWPEEDENAKPSSVRITAETPELRAFFERHAAGELFQASENPGYYVRLKSGRD